MNIENIFKSLHITFVFTGTITAASTAFTGATTAGFTVMAGFTVIAAMGETTEATEDEATEIVAAFFALIASTFALAANAAYFLK